MRPATLSSGRRSAFKATEPFRLRRPKADKPRCPMDSFADPQTDVASGVTRGRHVRSRCRCSMCPAIHINSRSWLRSSSTPEPSDPPLRVVKKMPNSAGLGAQQERRTRPRGVFFPPAPRSKLLMYVKRSYQGAYNVGPTTADAWRHIR